MSSQFTLRAEPRLRRAAYTLIEIVVVLALVATLMAITLPALRGARERSAHARATADLETIANALEEYRHTYGDYPQTGDCPTADANTALPLLTSHAQARFMNALSGAFGPTARSPADRINGRPLVDLQKLRLEQPLPEDFDRPTGSPPLKPELTNCVLDPWGQRYFYFYKSASHPEDWRAVGFVLFSAGADGEATLPDVRTGLLPADATNAAKDADNVRYAASQR